MMTRPGRSEGIQSDSQPGGCGFDFLLWQTFFLAIFLLLVSVLGQEKLCQYWCEKARASKLKYQQILRMVGETEPGPRVGLPLELYPTNAHDPFIVTLGF